MIARIYNVRSKRLVLMLDDSQNIIGTGHGIEPGAPSITLDVAALNIRQHLMDGVLHLDAQGLACIVTHVATRLARPTPRTVLYRLYRIVGGRAWMSEQVRALIRVGAGAVHAPGDSKCWLDAAWRAVLRPTGVDWIAERERTMAVMFGHLPAPTR
jgi:hypothetical protein